MRTWVIDTEVVKAHAQAGLDDPANLAAYADGVRQRALGWQYFTGRRAKFWHELTEAEQRSWLVEAQAELESLAKA